MERHKENLSNEELENLISLILEKIPVTKGLADQLRADGGTEEARILLEEYNASESKDLKLLIKLLIKYRGQLGEIIKLLQQMGINVEILEE